MAIWMFPETGELKITQQGVPTFRPLSCRTTNATGKCPSDTKQEWVGLLFWACCKYLKASSVTHQKLGTKGPKVTIGHCIPIRNVAGPLLNILNMLQDCVGVLLRVPFKSAFEGNQRENYNFGVSTHTHTPTWLCKHCPKGGC